MDAGLPEHVPSEMVKWLNSQNVPGIVKNRYYLSTSFFFFFVRTFGQCPDYFSFGFV